MGYQVCLSTENRFQICGLTLLFFGILEMGPAMSPMHHYCQVHERSSMLYYGSTPETYLQWLRERSDKSKGIKEKQSKMNKKLDKTENCFFSPASFIGSN